VFSLRNRMDDSRAVRRTGGSRQGGQRGSNPWHWENFYLASRRKPVELAHGGFHTALDRNHFLPETRKPVGGSRIGQICCTTREQPLIVVNALASSG
jgi:hypothetical protein